LSTTERDTGNSIVKMALNSENPHPTRATNILLHQKISIAAPASLVFSLLTDVSTYSAWNGFLTGVAITVDGKPVERTKIQVGDVVRMDCLFLDGQTTIGRDLVGYIGSHDSDQSSTGEKLKIYQVQWQDNNWPSFLLLASRLHTISELPESEGGGCTYVSELKFFGPLSYMVNYFVGEKLKAALQKGWLEGLKARAEKLAAENK
jgi:hypothetical protein